MVGWGVLSTRSLEGIPLAWGAKVYAGTYHRDPFFRRPLRARGHLRALTGTAARFFVGSSQEP
jgi:hypothetical protein